MSLLWLMVAYLTTLQIYGFDIGRKLWKDHTKTDGAEAVLSDLGSNMGGRNMPIRSDDSVESFLTKDTADFAERGLPLFNDELQDQDAAMEPYLTKEIPEFAERRWALLDDEKQDLDDLTRDARVLDGWYTYKNSWYYLSTYKTNWWRATKHCEALQGYLAEINDYFENLYLKRIAKSKGHLWVGGTYVREEGQWRWDHSRTPLYIHSILWRKGEPNNKGNDDEHCLELRKDGLNDEGCHESRYFVCEI